MNVKLLCTTALLLIYSLLLGCGGGSDNESSEQNGIVTGYVVSAIDDAPVIDATVRIGTDKTTTAADGGYSIQAPVSEQVVVHIDAENFAEAFPVTPILHGETSTLRTKLLPIGVNTPVSVAAGGTVSVPASTAQVTLPAASLVPSDGSVAATSVNVAVTPINPATSPDAMPGNYTAIAVGEEEPVTIESFGAMLVDIRDDSGTRYNLAEGETATIRIPLGTRSATPPTMIPLFYFNETTGLWIEEGSATLAGIAPDQYYEGIVSHFSYWNADRVMETVYVSGCVEDVNGDPVPNIYIRSDGSDYSGQDYRRNASDGSFRVAIRQDSEATIVGMDDDWQVITNEVGVGPYQSDYEMISCLIVTPPPLAITTTSLPDGAVETAYNATLIGSGGYPPYQWSITEQQLPTGLELNAATGEISGTPTTEGNSNFTVQLQDSGTPPSSVSKPLEMSIDWLSARSITAYSLAGVAGEINEATGAIAVTLPNGTDVTTLVAQFETNGTGTSVTVGTTVQISGVTANDFTNPVMYTVTAADGTPAYYTVTVTVETVTTAVWSMVSSGMSHTMAIKSDGSLWGWGVNRHSQLGGVDTNTQTTPIQIGSETNWAMVSAGEYHTLALKLDGTLWAWGNNSNGELGDGGRIEQPTPVQIGDGNTWVKVSAGDDHTVAMKSDGTLWVWGANYGGQLGDGAWTAKRAPTQIGAADRWSEISAGFAHTLAIKSDGTLWAWGENYEGQLGDGTVTNRNIPTQVGDMNDWSMVSAGVGHSVAIKLDGTLWAWGQEMENLPVQIGVADDWTSVSAGDNYTVAIQSDGSLWSWGYGSEGQLGLGNRVSYDWPKRVGRINNWTSVSASYGSTAATQSDGTLWVWGDNTDGLLGIGTASELYVTSPTNIP